jgi:hypothetical protein
MGRCLNVAMMLFATAAARVAAPFGEFLVGGGRTALRGRAVMPRRRRAMVRRGDGLADQLLDIAKKR